MRPCFPSNYALVQSLPTTEPVKRIMSKVDREIFCLHKVLLRNTIYSLYQILNRFPLLWGIVSCMCHIIFY